jgi:glycosyltransferase involved in cell wall biosynthesis
MASGCPVIASDVSSIPEVASDAAILVDPTDADAIAAAVQRVMGSPSVGAELRERGLARASLFSWDRAARQTIDAFAAVAV